MGYYDSLDPFGSLNQVRDVLGVVSAFALPVGDGGGGARSGVANRRMACALIRPDVFRSVVMMSTPFAGPPGLAFNTADAARGNGAGGGTAAGAGGVRSYLQELAELAPPRKYYQQYYTTPSTRICGTRRRDSWFLWAYYHMKSADWKQNAPFPLKARTASEWAKLPRYYVMDFDKGMAETVAAEMPSAAEIAACKWLPEDELKVYSMEYGRTGFQAG